MALGNFINVYILPNDEKIFSLIAKAIFIECNFKMDKMYLNGSKCEVNAQNINVMGWLVIKSRNCKINVLFTTDCVKMNKCINYTNVIILS